MSTIATSSLTRISVNHTRDVRSHFGSVFAGLFWGVVPPGAGKAKKKSLSSKRKSAPPPGNKRLAGKDNAGLASPRHNLTSTNDVDKSLARKIELMVSGISDSKTGGAVPISERHLSTKRQNTSRSEAKELRTELHVLNNRFEMFAKIWKLGTQEIQKRQQWLDHQTAQSSGKSTVASAQKDELPLNLSTSQPLNLSEREPTAVVDHRREED